MAPFFIHNNFLTYLSSERRFSEHTCLAYKKDIEQFIEFIAIEKRDDLTSIDSRLVRSWIVDLIESGYSSMSVNRKLSSLRTFFKWSIREGIVDKNPMRIVVGPKKQKSIPSFVKKNELSNDVMDNLFASDFNGQRDRMMFELFYQTGIRLSELIGLKISDVNPQQIKVLGKWKKDRIIPISSELYKQVEFYLKLRSELSSMSDNFLILSSGKKLYAKFVYRKINDYLGETTSLKKKSPHILRHTFATHMLNNGAGMEVLKELLGHANLSATQVYTHNSFKELTSIYSQSHPRGHKT